MWCGGEGQGVSALCLRGGSQEPLRALEKNKPNETKSLELQTTVVSRILKYGKLTLTF